jgi:hypothetical protein
MQSQKHVIQSLSRVVKLLEEILPIDFQTKQNSLSYQNQQSDRTKIIITLFTIIAKIHLISKTCSMLPLKNHDN